MTCPNCGDKTIVINSRPHEDNTYRRRECVSCCQRFSTVEIDADYYSTLKPINKNMLQEALLDGYAELKKRLYRSLKINERNSNNETESCT